MPIPDNSVVLYDFFKLLKKINEKLKSEELRTLLSDVDDNSNHSHNKFFVNDQALYREAMCLVEEISLYLVKHDSIHADKNILSAFFSALKSFNQSRTNQFKPEFSNFQVLDTSKLAALVNQYELAIDLLRQLSVTKNQIQKISESNDPYPSPRGIEQLEDLFKLLDKNRIIQGDNLYSMVLLNKICKIIRTELELTTQDLYELRAFYIDQSILFNKQRLNYQAKTTLLEKTLVAFIGRIEEIYATNTFPSVELISLREKLSHTEHLYDGAGQLNQENTNQLLNDLQNIIKNQLSNHTNKNASIQFFYKTSLSVLASLDQTPHSNSIAISSEEIFFDDMIVTFNNIKNHINSSQWNTQGQGFFSKKTPDGIIKLRKLFAELPTMQNAELINKINTIKKFMALYELTKQKILSKGRFRTDSVHNLYREIYNILDSAYANLNPEAKSKFYLAYIYNAEPSHGVIFSGISHNTPNAVTTLFNETPILPEDFVECCKKPQLTTGSGVLQKPNT
ncbi:MAG: hypothetical protein WA659_01995 [Candidatus Aquirickettsiella sp.]